MAARQRISEKLLANLAVVWEEHGKRVLERRTPPASWPRSLTGCCRKTCSPVSSRKTPGNLEPEAWILFRLPTLMATLAMSSR